MTQGFNDSILPTGPIDAQGVLGNYWDGNTFVIPQQPAQSSQTYWAGGLLNTPAAQPNYQGGSVNPMLSQFMYGGTPATGGALGSGLGFYNTSLPSTNPNLTGPLTGYGLPPGLLGPSFNNVLDLQAREAFGSTLR